MRVKYVCFTVLCEVLPLTLWFSCFRKMMWRKLNPTLAMFNVWIQSMTPLHICSDKTHAHTEWDMVKLWEKEDAEEVKEVSITGWLPPPTPTSFTQTFEWWAKGHTPCHVLTQHIKTHSSLCVALMESINNSVLWSAIYLWMSCKLIRSYNNLHTLKTLG